MKRLTILGVAAVLAVAGCGGDDDSGGSNTGSTGAAPSGSTGGGGGEQLTLTADANQLKYDKDALTAKAGKVTITMTNDGSLQHDVAIKGGGVDEKGEVVGQGGKSVVTADLKAGEYEFYCSVDGHEAAGMKGTLTVN